MKAIEEFASEVAANVLGVEKTFTDNCCGVVTDVLGPDEIEAGSTIALIIEVILTVIEKCKEKETFQKHVKEQTMFAKVWFRWQAFRNAPQLRFRGNDVSNRELAETILQAAAAKPATVTGAVWDEAKEPQWSVI